MSAEIILRDHILGLQKTMAKKMKKNKLSASIVEASIGQKQQLSGVYKTQVIPVDCFPMEYMLGQNGVPLHRILTLQGANNSCKSSLFWFIARIFLQNGGFVIYFDLENKHEPRTAQAYIGNPMAYRNRVRVFPGTVVEAFATQLQSVTDMFASDKELRGRPVLIGIDTLGTQLSMRYVNNLKAGKADPEYTSAKCVFVQQQALQYVITMHLQKLPMTIIALQQERKMMDDPEGFKASGGTCAGYAKSAALRMERNRSWRKADMLLPLLTVTQAKNSQNVQRSGRLILPCDTCPTGTNHKNFHFQWSYAMMQLLADLYQTSAEFFTGIFKVDRPNERTFTIKAKKGDDNEWARKYAVGSCSYREQGPLLLEDAGLRTILRDRLDLNIEPEFAGPYRIKPSHTGGLWLGPDERPDFSSLSESDIVKVFNDFTVEEAAMDEKERQASASDKDEEDEDVEDGDDAIAIPDDLPESDS